MNYPDEDFPYTMYFCGEVMPQWSAQWNWVARDLSHDGTELWHVLQWQLLCRIDHVGVVESEGGAEFRVCAQNILLHVLESPELARNSIGTAGCIDSKEIDPVAVGIVDGLFRMIAIAQARETVFWSSGYDADRLAVVEFMRRAELPDDHLNHAVAPDLTMRAGELTSECGSQTRRLHALAQSGRLSKTMRSRLHDIGSAEQTPAHVLRKAAPFGAGEA